MGDVGGDKAWYGYCLDDPVNGVDPLGLAAGDWWDFSANLGRAKEIAKEELAKRGSGNHNNEGDAIRHAEWSRRMTEEIGPSTSWAVGLGHEVGGLVKGQPWSEAMMDIKNNAEGRAAARDHKPIDLNKLQKQPKDGFQLNPYNQNNYWFQK